MSLRIAVTGANGFVGSHLLRVAYARGNEVCALVRHGSDGFRIADVASNVAVMHYALDAPEALLMQLRNWRPDVLVHAAWHGVRGAAREALRDQERNVEGAARAVGLAAAAGARHWIGLGSQDERASPTPYGDSKRRAAEITSAAAAEAGVHHTWLRLSAAYGPFDDHRRLVPSAVCAALSGRPGAFTAGDQRWDLLYVEDVARAILTVAERQAQGTYDVASGDLIEVRALIKLVGEIVGYRGPLGLGNLPYRPHEPMINRADVEPLRVATGWSPTVDLRAGLERTIAWFRDNPAACA